MKYFSVFLCFAGVGPPLSVSVCASNSGKLQESCEGFDGPETVLHHPQRDCYFVSCMVGNPTAHKNNGEIRIIDPSNPNISKRFVRGGIDGNILHSPKGMAIFKTTLWVADIDTLRAFDTKTGRSLGQIDLKLNAARAINDIAVDPRGAIFVSDPRLVFKDDGSSVHTGTDRIFFISPARKVTTIVKSNDLSQPNGLAWDEKNKRLLVAPLDSDKVLSVDPKNGSISVVTTSCGRFDGIELMPDGAILVSCLGEGTIRNAVKSGARPLVSGIKYPGNFGVDYKRNLLLVPLIADGRVEIWKM